MRPGAWRAAPGGIEDKFTLCPGREDFVHELPKIPALVGKRLEMGLAGSEEDMPGILALWSDVEAKLVGVGPPRGTRISFFKSLLDMVVHFTCLVKTFVRVLINRSGFYDSRQSTSPWLHLESLVHRASVGYIGRCSKAGQLCSAT
jgi:hypothetical protein